MSFSNFIHASETSERTAMRAPMLIIAPSLFVAVTIACLSAGFGVRGAGIALLLAIFFTFAAALTDGIRWTNRMAEETVALVTARQATSGRLPTTQANDQIEAVRRKHSTSFVALFIAALQASTNGDLATAYSVGETTVLRRARGNGALLRFCAGAVMFLGLLGTFLGMVAAVKGYRAAAAQDISAIDSLRTILSGLDNAFGTTIIGILASLLLGTINLDCRRYEQATMREAGDFVLDAVLPVMRRSAADRIADIVDDAVHRTLPAVVEASSRDLRDAAKDLATIASTLSKTTKQLPGLIDELRAALPPLVKAVGGLNETNTTIAGQLSAIRDTTAAASATFTIAAKEFPELPVKLAAALTPTADRLMRAATSIEERSASIDATIRGAAQATQNFAVLSTESAETRERLAAVRSAMDFVQQAADGLSTELRTSQKVLQRAAQEAAGVTRSLQETRHQRAGLFTRIAHAVFPSRETKP